MAHLRGGFTLTEALLASTVLAIAITSITMPFVAGARAEQSNERRTVAVSLAQEMMEEVLSKPFADPDGVSQPGPESDEPGRSYFDNIDDYDGYAESEGDMVGMGGFVVAGDTATIGLSRHVTADYIYVSGQDTSETPTFIRITVEVRHDGRPVTTLTRLAYEAD